MKSFSKVTMVILSFILPLTLFVGCKKVEPPAVTEEPRQRPTEVVVEPEPEPATTTNTAELPDDLYSFTIMLDGEVYELPAPFSEFAANGWEIQESLGVDYNTETLKPNSYTGIVVVKHGEHQIYMDFVNPDVNVNTLPDCYVGGVQLDDFDAKHGAELVFPGGITLGDTQDKVIKLYGDPSDTNENTFSSMMTYTLSTYSEVKVSFSKETGGIDQLKMQNLEAKKGSPKTTTGTSAASGDVPNKVTSYKAPASLGKSWDSFTVKYDGVVYQMPIPVSELLANGWVCVSDEDTLINGQGYLIGFEIRKGNQTLRTSLSNYDDNQQPAKYCMVTRVECYTYGAKIHLELPQGLSEKSKVEDFIKAYGEPTKIDEGTVYTSYTWGKVFEELYVSVDKETGKIEKLEVSYDPKTLPW